MRLIFTFWQISGSLKTRKPAPDWVRQFKQNEPRILMCEPSQLFLNQRQFRVSRNGVSTLFAHKQAFTSDNDKSMNTTPVFPFPFKLPSGLSDLPSWLQPPAWLVGEVQHRIVLALNHVLQQEPQAMERLARQKGRVASIESAGIAIKLIATPAGLLDVAAPDAKSDLSLTVLETDPLKLAQTLFKGEKPALRIEGDIQLAAEVNWLVDHVRWDAQEDLSRVMGDGPAHSVVSVLSQAIGALKKFAPASAARG